MKASLLFEVHGWRGFGKERDLFCIHVVCGFFTIVTCKQLVSDRLKNFSRKLDEIEEKMRDEE